MKNDGAKLISRTDLTRCEGGKVKFFVQCDMGHLLLTVPLKPTELEHQDVGGSPKANSLRSVNRGVALIAISSVKYICSKRICLQDCAQGRSGSKINAKDVIDLFTMRSVPTLRTSYCGE